MTTTTTAAAAAATASPTNPMPNPMHLPNHYADHNPFNLSGMSSPFSGGSPSPTTILDFAGQTADAITILVSPDHFHDHGDDDGEENNVDEDEDIDNDDNNNNDEIDQDQMDRRRYNIGAHDFSTGPTTQYNGHHFCGAADEFSFEVPSSATHMPLIAMHNRSHNLHNYHQYLQHHSLDMASHLQHQDTLQMQAISHATSAASTSRTITSAGEHATAGVAASAVALASSATASAGKVCPVCHKTFSRAWSLQRHMTDRHFYVPQHLECDICGRTYRSRNSLISHKSQYHGAGVSSKVVAAAAAAATAAATSQVNN